MELFEPDLVDDESRSGPAEVRERAQFVCGRLVEVTTVDGDDVARERGVRRAQRVWPPFDLRL